MTSRGPSLPPARAIGLFARTVYRQLKQAGYSESEVVAFVNELLGHVGEDAGLGPMTGVTDVETALPNPEAFLDALDYELKRAPHNGTTLLVSFDVELPDSCPDDFTAQIHALVARQLRRGVRPTDTVARLGPDRYAVIFPGATVERSVAIASRLLGPIVKPRRREDRFPDGTRVEIRAAQAVGDDAEVASNLLARCLATTPSQLVATASGAPPPRTIPPPPPRRPEILSESAAAPPNASSSAREDAVVLALGGGAARAAAHIGVLRAFASHGVRVSGVAGTSAGALVGAMALSGMSHSAILERFLAFTKSTIYREMRRSFVLYRRASAVPRASVAFFRESGLAFLSSERLAAFDDELLERFVEFFVGPDRDITSLDWPFIVAATDLITGRSIHVAHGPLHRALRASCALPGLFLPQHDEDRVLIDGSTVAEVPVRAAVALGLPLPVVAVHLARPERKIDAFTNSSEVVLRSAAVVHKELVREQLRHANHLITAPVDEIGWLDFRRAEDTALLGERAALRHLENSRRPTIPPTQ
jgi:NTE family protein